MWNKPHALNAMADVLFVATAAAVLAVGTVWLVRMPQLPIRQVVVESPLNQLRRAEIEQALAGNLRGNFFSVNVEAVRVALEQLPWVRRVQVRRLWPARLQLKIEEHRPVARWEESRAAGRNELVNSYGEVFIAFLTEKEALALPQMYGPTGTAPDLLRRFAEFSEMLGPVGLRPVQLSLSPRLAWQLQANDGMLIELGREQAKSPVAMRLQRFVEIYPGSVGNRPQRPAAVDLRYPNGFALRSRG